MFNVTRGCNPPNCLSSNIYNTKEVVDALHSMFFGKCYLCERDSLQNPEIEHLDPHEGDPKKKYDWNNLYYSCGRCNSIKSNAHKNILDCCDPIIDVFKEIKCILPSIPDDLIIVVAANSLTADVRIKNTVNLLDKCYNEKNTPIREITRSTLIDDLFGHYAKFLGYMLIIKDKKSTDLECNNAIDRMKSMIADDFPFSVFWRWHILGNSFLSMKLKDCINF